MGAEDTPERRTGLLCAFVAEFHVRRQEVGEPTVEPARLYAELIRLYELNWLLGLPVQVRINKFD